MTSRLNVAGLSLALCLGVFATLDASAQISYQTGTVAGVVSTRDGQALEGVRVVASSLAGQGQVETWIVGATYSLTLPVGDYEVSARLEHELVLGAPVVVTVLPQQTVAVDFVFPGAAVHLQVSADGDPAVGSQVHIRRQGPTSCAAADTCWWTSDDGSECHCELGGEEFYCNPDGCEWMNPTEVWASADEAGEVWKVLPSQLWTVEVRSAWVDGQNSDVTVAELSAAVPDGGVVELGRVDYATGLVSGTITAGGLPLENVQLRASQDGSWGIYTYASAGAFTLRLPAGTYTLLAVSDNEEIARAEVTVVAGDALVVDFAVPGGFVGGELLEDGAPARDAQVSLVEAAPADCSAADSCYWQNGLDDCHCEVDGREFYCSPTEPCQWLTPRQLHTSTDETGHYRVFAPPGTYDVVYYAVSNRYDDPELSQQYGTIRVATVDDVTVADGADVTLATVDYRTGRVGGALTSCGEPLAGLQIRATRVDGGGQVEAHYTDGAYLLQLPVGEYALSFGLEWRLELATIAVTVTAGATADAPFDPSFGTLRGIIRRDGAPVEGALAELHREGPPSCADADTCFWDDGQGSCYCELGGSYFECDPENGCSWHDSLVRSAWTDGDGTFTVAAPGGDYTLRAYSDEVPGQYGRIFVGSVDADLTACALTEIGASIGQVYVGDDVFVDLGGGVSVSFAEVTEAGTASFVATSNPQGGPAPDQVRFLGLYYDIVVEATYSPPITVCIAYDPADVVSGQAPHLKLFHRTTTGWEDATTSVDAVNHVVCGVVQSLSWFVAGLPTELPPIAPVADAGDDLSFVLEGGACAAEVVLDGTRSVDGNSTWPSTDDAIVRYTWTEGGVVLAEGSVVTVALPAGEHEIVLTVEDADGLAAEDGVVVAIVDPQVPELTCDMIPVCPETGDRNTVCHKGKKTLHLGNGNAAVAHLAHGDTAGPCGGDHQVPDGRALVCHAGRTLEVSAAAVPAHVGHGDYVGPCGAGCDDNQQLLRASWALSESCDPSWAAVGRVNGVVVAEGQVVDWTQTVEGASGAFVDGALDVDAPKLALVVRADNGAGQQVSCRWLPDVVVTECTEQQQGAVDQCLDTCVAPPPPPDCVECDQLVADLSAQCVALGLQPMACEQLHDALGASCSGLFCGAIPTDCPIGCEELSSQARAVCEASPELFEPVSCEDGAILVSELCHGQICGATPSCEDMCLQQADAEREACLASGEPPEDCEWRWQESYETCVQTQCQAPVPCEQTCFEQLQPELFACIQGEPDSPECAVVGACLEQCGGCPALCQLEAARAYAPCLVDGGDPSDCEPAATEAYQLCVAACGGGCPAECVAGDGACPASCPLECDADCEPFDPCDPDVCRPDDGECLDTRCDPACDPDCEALDPCDPVRCASGDGACGDGCDPTCDADCVTAWCDPVTCASGDGICDRAWCDETCDDDCAVAYCDPTVCRPGDGVCDRAWCDETCDDDCAVAYCDPTVCRPGDGVCDRAWCDETCDDDCAVAYCDPTVCRPGDGVCDRAWCDETCDDDCGLAFCDPMSCRPGDGICDHAWCDETCDDDCVASGLCESSACVSGDGFCDPTLCDASCDADCDGGACDPTVCVSGDGVCPAGCAVWCDEDCAQTATCPAQCEEAVRPVRDQCDALVADPEPCELLGGAAIARCEEVVCSGAEPACDGGCNVVASDLLALCEPILGAAVCELGFTALTDSCLRAFGCAVAPSCEQQCEVAALDLRMQCEDQGGDPMECELLWQSALDACLVGCDPPPVGCEDQCQAEGEALFEQCVTPDDLDL